MQEADAFLDPALIEGLVSLGFGGDGSNHGIALWLGASWLIPHHVGTRVAEDVEDSPEELRRVDLEYCKYTNQMLELQILPAAKELGQVTFGESCRLTYGIERPPVHGDRAPEFPGHQRFEID